MNKVILMGRLTRKPEISWNEEDLCIARFTLAVDRRFKREGQQDADFIGCVAFGKNAEFADKYLNQGTKIALEGRIQTGSYIKTDGTKVYTTEIVAAVATAALAVRNRQVAALQVRLQQGTITSMKRACLLSKNPWS